MADVTPFMKRAYAYFTEQGYSPQAAAALAGHGQWESGGSSTIQDPRGEGSIGLYQWRQGRRDGLNNFAKVRGLDPLDEKTQLAFTDYELNGTEKSAGDQLRSAQSVDDANRAMMNFLRPQGWAANNPEAGHGWANRVALSNAIAGSDPTSATTQIADAPAPAAPPRAWDEKLSAYVNDGTQDRSRSLVNNGLAMLQLGSAPGGGGPTSQIVGGQPVSLLDLVFGNGKRQAA